MFVPRPYQDAARAAVYDHLRTRDDNPCVIIPTAGGKTPVMASICKDVVGLWQGRVLILAHVKELLEQAAEKLTAICPGVPFGIYSAGLNRRDTESPVLLAGIQSVYRRACELGPFDMIFVDEAHLIPPEGEGMYRQFLADSKVVNPHVRVVGFTATAFRMRTGAICTPEGILNHVCFEVGVRELIRDGYLCPLVSRAGKAKANTDQVNVRAGEFVADELEAIMDQDALVQAACNEIVQANLDRKACLIFATGIQHGRHVQKALEGLGQESGFVYADTPVEERDEILKRFRAGDLKYLCNVNVLTTGFDATIIDCVALLRPTLSPGLYYQMVGRGFRLHSGKKDCLILDFGGNVLRHGPVDELCLPKPSQKSGQPPAKECPQCAALIALGYSCCPNCGFGFPPPERQAHAAQATQAEVLSTPVKTTVHSVQDVFYSVYRKRGASEDAPCTLRVDYKVGWQKFKTEWIFLEHGGYPRHRAAQWWKRRSLAGVPDTAQEAVDLANNGALLMPKTVTVREMEGDDYERIVAYELDELAEDDIEPTGGEGFPAPF